MTVADFCILTELWNQGKIPRFCGHVVPLRIQPLPLSCATGEKVLQPLTRSSLDRAREGSSRPFEDKNTLISWKRCPYLLGEPG